MNRRISKKMEQSSVELSLNNGIINSQSNWSRCSSFSSSSSDSTLYCSTSPQRSSFSGRKRLKTDEPVPKMVKRSRNSSGSSASSNLSCLSDKDVSRMPTLISPEQVNNIETLADISPSSLALQHEALLNSRLSHPLDMNSVLPFRHNLRRNIRKKKCSCDCTATCTTVVVSRQYKGMGEQTVEEKTVISHTKVKTFVESSATQTPVRQVQVSSKVSFQENVAHKNECSFQENVAQNNECSFQENVTEKKECLFQENGAQQNECSFQENMSHKNESNRKRRSEIEKLYDSLHEIKWAKNFSPDNILRQFDVRQAASCSVFGKASPAKSNNANKCSKISDIKLPNKSGDIKIDNSNSTRQTFKTTRHNSYTTRSMRRSLRNSQIKLKEDDSNPPVLEKSIITVEEALNIDSPHYNTYPVLSKEVVTPEKDTNTTGCVDFTSSSTETDCTFSNLSKSILNLDLNPHCDIDSQIATLTGCSSTFFDITEDNIHTIDACFREVGAEVVVSTCCDTDCSNLPLLTAVKEIHSSNIKSLSHDCPPVLEQCESTFSSSQDNSLKNCSNTSDAKHSVEPLLKKFFPQVSSQLIPAEDYSPPLSFLEDCERNFTTEDNNKNFDENNGNTNFTTEHNEKRNCAVKDDNKKTVENNNKRNCTVEDNDKNFVGNNDRRSYAAEDNGRNCAVQSFCDIDSKMILENKLNIPNLMSQEEKKTLNQNIIFEPGPPILEPCMSNEICCINVKSEVLITENVKNEDVDFHKEVDCSFGEVCNKVNCKTSRTNNISIKSRFKSQSKSLIISSGRRVLKKYIKFINSKSRRQNNLSKMCNRPSKNTVVSQKALPVSNAFCKVENLTSDNFSSVIPLSLTDCAQMPSPVKIINSSVFSHSSPPQITKNCISTPQITKKCISSSESTCLQSTSTVTNAKSATVIQSFNQKLTFSTSEENVTLNQIQNSSILIKAEKKPCLNNKKAKKPSLQNIFNNHYSENFADIPGYAKILSATKKKEGPPEEKVKVPPRVFTCHFQTINVTRGNDYIQIVLKITRGKSIFLTHETLVELKEAIIKAGNDKDCRLLILNGFGQTFCLGLDLRPLVGERKNEVVSEIANAVKDLIGTLADFQKPLVAIVNGAAYGLGLTILNHADVTLATSNASFCMPYSRLGYMPEGGATLTLPQAVGTTVAMDLILRGQVITAEQARDIGLVTEVVEVRHLPQDLVSRVKKFAENSLPGMEATKAMIKMRLHIQLPLVLETEAKLLPQMWLSPSCQEAIQNALNSGFFEDC